MSRDNRAESAYYHLVCYPEPACCSGSRTRRQLGRRGRAGWAAEEGTGCWSDREENRQCCGLLVSSKRSAAVLETGKCCRKTDGCRKLSSDDMLDILGDEIAEPPTPSSLFRLLGNVSQGKRVQRYLDFMHLAQGIFANLLAPHCHSFDSWVSQNENVELQSDAFSSKLCFIHTHSSDLFKYVPSRSFLSGFKHYIVTVRPKCPSKIFTLKHNFIVLLRL